MRGPHSGARGNGRWWPPSMAAPPQTLTWPTASRSTPRAASKNSVNPMSFTGMTGATDGWRCLGLRGPFWTRRANPSRIRRLNGGWRRNFVISMAMGSRTCTSAMISSRPIGFGSTRAVAATCASGPRRRRWCGIRVCFPWGSISPTSTKMGAGTSPCSTCSAPTRCGG